MAAFSACHPEDPPTPGGGGNGDDGNTASFNKYSFALITLIGLLAL